MGFGLGLAQGAIAGKERMRNRRAKVFDAFQRWKQDNPYATAADFQGAVRAIGGGDLSIAGTLPGDQAIQRMAQENALKKQEAEKQKAFEQMQRQLNMETTKLNFARTAIETYGDKADANMLSKQFGLPAEVFAPALEQARSEAAAKKAKEDQANNVKALEYYMSAANAALEAGRTPQEAHDAGIAASGRYASAAGFDLDLGAVGKPSSFQSGTSSHLADMQVAYDAKIQARSSAISEDIARRVAGDPAYLEQIITDPSGAISSAALGIYDENDPAFVAALPDIEKRIHALAEKSKKAQDASDMASAGAVYSSVAIDERNGDTVIDPSLIAGQEDTIRTAMVEGLIAQGMPEQRAVAAVDAHLANQQPALETAFDAQYNDPRAIQEVIAAEAAASAQSFISPLFDEKGGVKIGNQGVFVGIEHQRQIANLMAGKVFYDEEERNLYFRSLVGAASKQMQKGEIAFASAKELDDAAYQSYEDKAAFPAGVSDYAQSEEILTQQQDNFASTSEMGEADLQRALIADANFEGVTAGGAPANVDIRMDAVLDAINIRDDKERKAATASIQSSLVLAIADAEAYRDAVMSGQPMRIVDFGELPPQHRLARGVQYDRAEHVLAIEKRIVDLNRRLSKVKEQTGFQSALSAPSRSEKPVMLSNYVTNVQMGADPKRPNSRKVIGSRDVMFSEALSVPEPEMNLFADSIEATLLANASTRQKMPELVAAVSSANSAREPDVVTAIANALEAYDFMRAFGEDNRLRGSAGASAFNRTMAEMGIDIKVGTLTPEVIDEAARKYAEQWVSWNLSGREDFNVLQKQINELILLTEGREGMDMTAGADFTFGYLDLPRAREAYGTGR